MIQYIANEEHYSKVLEKAKKVKKSLWIGTSDIKDVYVKVGIDSTQPFLSVLSTLIKNGVEVRLHSPFLLSIPNAKIYNLDAAPAGLEVYIIMY